MNSQPHVLIVAGSDPSGGAGIARDVETVAAFGLHASLAITAVTVQTHDAVRAVEIMKPALVEQQMRAALEAGSVKAIKIGMLATAETVEAVASVLRGHAHIPLTLDPVLAASSGRALLEPEAIELLKRELMPLCTLTTPNLIELSILTGQKRASSEAEAISQGQMLLREGCPAVLIKGGHASGVEATDILTTHSAPPQFFTLPRLDTEMRGTGCILASAIASLIARGDRLEDSVKAAKTFLYRQLSQATHGSVGSHQLSSETVGLRWSRRSRP